MAQNGDEPTRERRQDAPTRQPQTAQPSGQAQAAAPSPGLGITGMVLGIVGVFLFWIPLFGWILPILALIFGIIGAALNRGRGMAIAGIVLGALEILAIVLMIAFGAMTTRPAIDEAIEEIQRQQQQQRQESPAKPDATQ